MRREVARPWLRRPGPRETHVGGSHVRAGCILPAVTCMSCIRYFSSDYHQKWPRTHLRCNLQAWDAFRSEEDADTENINIFGKNGEKSQGKNIQRDSKASQHEGRCA